jgi:transposase-like protein
MIFDNYARSEAALIATMAEMVVNGVSTRKVTKVMETLCGLSFSKSEVSNVCKTLDKEVKEFQERPLDDSYPFLWVDATYFKVREDHRIKSKAFFVALGFRSDGYREVIGFDVFDTEENYSWLTFFRKLKSRGLSGVKMVISDAHPSIRKALTDTFPQAAWQRCQVHFERNILDATPNRYKEGLKSELRNMFNATSISAAEQIKESIVADYQDVAKTATEILESGFWDSMTVMSISHQDLRVPFRTSNILERLNRELKRRSDAIQIFPNADSVQRLMGAVTMEYSEHQSSIHRLYSEKRYLDMEPVITQAFSDVAERQRHEVEAA